MPAGRDADTISTPSPAPARRVNLWWWAAIFGPGLMVMLADTDVGSAITAAQSGVAWRYAMILPQVALMPILYVVQEMTVRLGIITQEGHGAGIRRHFGLGWGLVSVGTLFLVAIGALITEFSGIAGVSQLVGVPVWLGVSVAAAVLIVIGLAGAYRRVEGIGIALGALEAAFFVTAVLAHPVLGQVARGLTTLPLARPGYLFLLAANVGAVIMPWMIFYQQGAVIQKRWTVADLRRARWDTGIGAVITQLLMIAIVVTAAATLAAHHAGGLESVGEISRGLTAVMGAVAGRLVWGAGILGAGLVAALVSSLAGAWGISEVLGIPHSLNHRLSEEPWFYVIYAMAHVVGALLVMASVDLVQLTVDVEVMNAMLLPIVLGFLLALEARALPPAYRMRGTYRWVAYALCGLVMAFGLYTVASVL